MVQSLSLIPGNQYEHTHRPRWMSQIPTAAKVKERVHTIVSASPGAVDGRSPTIRSSSDGSETD